jgi:DNA-binding IclR family transcriptional regulator
MTAAMSVPFGQLSSELNDDATAPSGGQSPQLLERTFTTLALFTPSAPDWTMTEIARACGLAVPTVHRIVSALQRHEFLIRDVDSKRYRLGPAILRMGRTAELQLDMRAMCHSVLEKMAQRTRETALLTLISDDRSSAVCIDRVESAKPLRLSVRCGNEMPLHAGALQTVLLAYSPPHEVDRYLAQPLERVCNATIVDPDAVREHLATIRQAGFSYSYEETNTGVWGLAVALLDDGGHARLAFGVAGPRERRPRLLGPWLGMLASEAHELGQALTLQPSLCAVPRSGGPGPPPGNANTSPSVGWPSLRRPSGGASSRSTR